MRMADLKPGWAVVGNDGKHVGAVRQVGGCRGRRSIEQTDDYIDWGPRGGAGRLLQAGQPLLVTIARRQFQNDLEQPQGPDGGARALVSGGQSRFGGDRLGAVPRKWVIAEIFAAPPPSGSDLDRQDATGAWAHRN